MEPSSPQDPGLLTRAHVVPFAVFMAFLVLLQFAGSLIQWDHPAAPWWRQDPAQWVYPLQTVAALGCLIFYWRHYEFHWSLKWSLVGAVFGAVGIGFWLLPTQLHDIIQPEGAQADWLKHLGVVPRDDGFDPGIFTHPAAYWGSLVLRFVRAAVVVALIEEIFWRGFVMRLVLDWHGNYWKQPFGRGNWLSYGVVTALFMIAHAPVDYAGAFVYGSLAYALCIWSRNLGACVVMHAVANLLMGLYIMATGKYGLW